MLQKLFILVVAGSLAIAVLIAVLWIVSYWTSWSVSTRRVTIDTNQAFEFHDYEVTSNWGILRVSRRSATVTNLLYIVGHRIEAASLTEKRALNFKDAMPDVQRGTLRQEKHSFIPGVETWSWEADVPYWQLFGPAMILPAFWVMLVARRHLARQREGYCGKCGYDLRASQDRCPECGTPFGGTTGKL